MRALGVFALAAGIAVAGGLGGVHAAADNAAAVLAPLEAVVAADPDSLRHASEYRQAVIRLGEHDRALDFFEKLVAAHPKSANAWLNYGYAYVDKIPAAGAITQVILANDAVTQFSKSIELDRSWLALYAMYVIVPTSVAVIVPRSISRCLT